MSWYAAHIIMSIKFKDTEQEEYPTYENVILIEANSDDEALSKAEKRGKADEIKSDDFTWNEHSAMLVFEGIRKLIDCEDPNTLPCDGTEITYSQMIVETQEELSKLACGDSTVVKYEE